MDIETPNHLDEDPKHTNYEEFATLSVLEKTPTDETPLLDHEQKFKAQLKDYSFVDNFFIRKIREFYDKDQILASKFNQKFRSKQWKMLDQGYMKIDKEREEVLKKKVDREENKTTSKLSNDKTPTEKFSASGSEQEFKAQPNDYSFIETRLFRKAFELCDERHIRHSDKIQTHGSEEQKKRNREKMEKRKAKIDEFRVKDAKHKAKKE